MADQNFSPNPKKEEIKVDLRSYTFPKKPMDQFKHDVETALKDLRAAVVRHVEGQLVVPARAAAGGNPAIPEMPTPTAEAISFWDPGNRHTDRAVIDAQKKAFIDGCMAHFNGTPLFAHYVPGTVTGPYMPGTLIVPTGIHAVDAQQLNEEHKAAVIKDTVAKTVDKILGTFKQGDEKNRYEFLSQPRGLDGRVDVDRIIRGARVDQHQRDIATSLGLDGKVSFGLSRIAQIATFWGTHIGGAAALFMLPPPGNIAVTAGLTVFNLGVQFFKGNTVDNRTSALLEKVTTLAEKSPNMETALFWTGHLYKIVRDANPVLFAKNRTELFNNEQSASVGAVLSHLEEAAKYAGQRMSQDCLEKPFEYSVKDGIFDGHLARAKTELEALAERWRAPNGFLGFSTWTATLSTLAWGATLL